MIGIDKIRIIDLEIAIDWATFADSLGGDHVCYKPQGKSTIISDRPVNFLTWQSPTKGKSIAFDIKYNGLLNRHMTELTICPASILRENNRQPVTSAREFMQAYEAARAELAADGLLLPQTINPATAVSYIEINTTFGLLEPYEAYSKSLRYLLQNIKTRSASLDKQIGTTLERGNKSAAWILYDKAAALAVGFTSEAQDAALRVEYKLKTAAKVRDALGDNHLHHILEHWHILPACYAAAVKKQILLPVVDAVAGDIKAHAAHLRTYVDKHSKFVSAWISETQTIFDAEHLISAYTQVMRGRIQPATLKSQRSQLRQRLRNRDQQPLRKGAIGEKIIGQQALLDEILHKLHSAVEGVQKRITSPTIEKPA